MSGNEVSAHQEPPELQSLTPGAQTRGEMASDWPTEAIPPDRRPIAVVGPTASGKSALGLALAHALDGEIVNADSMQLYRGMDIGTAKLSVAEREGIPHHQLDVLDVTQTASVAAYQQRATRDVEAILDKGRVPIVVGGSMLYLQALIDAWQFPPTSREVRRTFEAELERVGVAAMHARLAAIDPEAARIIEPNDPRRTVRALEVIELTGQPFQASQPPKNAPPRWGMRILGLRTEPDWLGERIERRTNAMFAGGLAQEVAELVREGLVRDSTAGRAIGYAQCLDVFAQDANTPSTSDAPAEASERERSQQHLDPGAWPGERWAEAEALTVQATRRYVRRQRSWFRRDPRIRWVEAAEHPVDQALKLLQ